MPNTPNLLIIYCDQLSSWTLSCYGGHQVHTPHIDRLSREGVQLNQFFTNVALCTPSRACFMTGRYPNQTGIYHGDRALGSDQVTFAQQLKAAGYETGYAGKWHLAGQRKDEGNWQPSEAFGWDDNRFMWNRGHFKHIDHASDPIVAERKVIGDQQSYSSDWLTDRALDFITQQREAPFAYMVSFPDPHQPYQAREPYASMFPPDEVDIPTTFWQQDVPDWIARDREDKDFPMATDKPWCPDREQRIRQLKSQYCAMVKHLDDCVGRLLDGLETNGLLDDTIVLFTTDHGDLMGEHGMSGKNYLYEPAYRVPFLIRWPEKLTAGRVVDRMVSTVDVMPTLLDLMHVPLSGQEEGRSALALLEGQPCDWDDVVFTHPYGFNRVACFTPTFELGFDHDGESILFDRINDPDQVANLYLNANHAATITAMREQMEAHYAKTCPQVLDWLPGNHGMEKTSKL